jgi:hypothetical protein
MLCVTYKKSVGDQPYTLVLFRYGVKCDTVGLVLPVETPLCEGQNSNDVVSLVLPAHTACHMQRKKLASYHTVGD